MAHPRRGLYGRAARVLALPAAALVLAACASPEPAARPSLLLVTIDTLRADRIGRGVAPALDRLAAEGVTFVNARANVPLTLPSHVTIMTGALPPEHGVRENGVHRFDGSRPTLARLLRAAGYRTGAVVGAFVLDRRFGLDDGFDEYDDRVRRDRNASNRLEAERGARDVADAAIRWLAGPEAARPFFLWAHFYDPHAPYDPPEPFRAARGGHAYDGEVAYAAAESARVIDAARRRAAGSLIVVVAGDHGEGLGEHGEATHGMLAYDSTLRVPLVIAGPGLQPGRIETPVTLRDVAPTLLARAGVARPAEMTGADLLGGRPSDAYAETTYPRAAGWSALAVLAEERWKIIQSSETELYDLQRDPAETANLAARYPQVAAALGARARAILSSGRVSAAPAAADARERLRALGYVSASPSSRSPDGAPNPRTGIDAWNRFERALSRLTAGAPGDALPDLASLAREHPGARVFQSTLAQALRAAGRARDALAVYRALVQKWPDDAALFHDLAAAARDAGAADEALRAEQAALALDPADASAHNGIGLLHADAGRHADAEAAFGRAVDLDASNASLWVNLGNARRASGRLDAAAQAYGRALEIDPDHPDAANGRGVLLVQQRRPAEAVPWFERAVRRDPGLIEAQLNLGIALQEIGERARAAEQYRKVLAAAPGGSRERKAAAELLAALR